jgi:hypothetical protein
MAEFQYFLWIEIVAMREVLHGLAARYGVFSNPSLEGFSPR